MIDRALIIARDKNRNDLVTNTNSQKKPQDQRRAAWDNKLTITTPFSVEFDSIKKIIHNYLPILCVDEILKTVVNVVSCQAPSLGRYLSPSFFS